MLRSLRFRSVHDNCRQGLPLEALEDRKYMAAGNPFHDLADGFQQRVGELRDQIIEEGPGIFLPFIEDPLGRLEHLVQAAGDAVRDALYEFAGETAEDEVQQTLFNLLSGAGVLGDGNGDGTIDGEDVEVQVNFADAESPLIDINLDLGEALGATDPDVLDFDIGLPALPVYMQGSGGIQASFGYALRNVNFGVDAEGFFFNLNNGDQPDLAFFAEAGLTPDFNLEGAFGFIHGQISGTDEFTGVSAEINIDFDADLMPTLSTDVTAGVNLQLDAQIIRPEFPGVRTVLDIEWPEGLGEAPVVAFRDISVTLDNKFLAPIVEHLEPILKPAGWVVDKLNARLPVISDLSEAIGQDPVSVLSILRTLNLWDVLPDDYEAISKGIVLASDIIDIVSGFSADDGQILLELGSFEVGGNFNDAALDITDKSGVNLSGLTIDPSSFDPQALDIDAVQDQLADLELGEFGVSLIDALEQLKNGYRISFPLLDDPGRALFPLLLGQDTELFTLEAHFTPTSDYDATFGTPIGIDAGLKGVFDPELSLTFGLDSHGLRTYVRNRFSGGASPSDLLGGFYFGEDTEFRLTTGIEASAGVNAVFFHADVTGSILGEFKIVIPDEAKAAAGEKVRLHEHLGKNLFDVSGDITAQLSASVGVGVEVLGNFIGVEKEWVLASKKLFGFSIDSVPNPWAAPQVKPILAGQAPDGTVELYVGGLGGMRNHQQGVTDEIYYVSGEQHDGALAIDVYFMGAHQRFENVTGIVGSAGIGNDQIAVDLKDAGAGVVVGLQGGDGTDTLSVTGGDGVSLNGNAGNDALSVINAQSATLTGGQDNDTLVYEGGGNATLQGGSGADSLYGGMGDNRLEGGTGNDVLVGGLGTNDLYGNAGDDHLTAGPNGDQLFGGDGSDGYTTGAGDDVISVTDGQFGTTENISWEFGDGNTFINAPGGDASNGLKVILGMLGSSKDDSFRVHDAAAGTVLIDAPDGKRVTGTGLDDISIDGAGGEDHIIIEALESQDVDRIAVNLNDNLDDDRVVDLIQVFGSPGDDGLTVDKELAILQAYDPADYRNPENLLWGGVMTVSGMPNYTVYAMNVADDLRVQTLAGNDTVQVNGITGPTLIDTSSGDDAVHVSAVSAGTPGDATDPPDYAAELVVESGDGSNVLTIDEVASAAGDLFVITDERISSGLLPGVNYRASGGEFSTVAVYGSTHDDTFQVHSTATAAQETVVAGVNGNDTFEVGVSFGSLAGIRSPLTLNAGAVGNSTATLSDRAAASGNFDVVLAGSSVTGLAGPADDVPVRVVSAGGSLSLTVEGSQDRAVAERFTLDAFLRPVTVVGGGGNEQFHVSKLAAKAWLHGGDGDDLYNVGKDLALIGATLTIADGQGRNVIDVNDSAAPGGRVYQLKAGGLRRVGTAYDQLNLKSARGTFNLLATPASDQFRALGALTGLLVNVDLGTGTNVLVGPNAPTRWDVVGQNEAQLGKLGRFRNAAHLVGGTADDLFAFAPAGRITGMVMAGTGTDTLDYSDWSSPVSVDLAANRAAGVSGTAFGIEKVTGGRGDDVLLGDTVANQLDGGAGNDLLLGRQGNDVLFGGAGIDVLIGNTGGDRLFGGDGDDLLIGGATTHDADTKALLGVFSTWSSKDLDYAGRVAALRAGPLSLATVLDDGQPDLLQGQQGADWFWAFAGDTTDRTLGEALQ